MRKFLTALAVVCIVATFGTGLASAARGGADRPWTGHGSGTLNQVTGGSTGTINLSHLGLSTTVAQATSSTGGTIVITAANGDQLFEDYGNITPISSAVFSFDSTITSGSGRFSGATGGGVTTITLTPTINPAVFDFTSTFSGLISY